MTALTPAPAARTWPWWRKLLCLVAAVLVGVAAWSRPGAVSFDWAAGLAVATANVLAAFCFVQGLPHPDASAPAPAEEDARPPRPLARALGWLAYPLVAAPVNCLLVIGAFGSGLVDRAAANPASWTLLAIVMTVLGMYADLVVLLPGVIRQVGPGMQVLFAAVCGVIDEFPGIGVMAMHRHGDGVAMWIIAQPVIFPVLIALMVQWFQHDQARAREEDARLDALESGEGGPGLEWGQRRP